MSGAVIREWMYHGYDGIAVVGSERTVEWDALNSDTVVDLVRPVEEHNALVAYSRQQAAEIERLTREVAKWKSLDERHAQQAAQFMNRFKASEARAAALEPYEKLALQLTDACVRWGWGHCTAGPELIGQIDSEIARNADLLKLIADLADNLSDEGVIYSGEGLDDRRKRVADALGNDCPEWLLEHQSAAAKGETV